MDGPPLIYDPPALNPARLDSRFVVAVACPSSFNQPTLGWQQQQHLSFFFIPPPCISLPSATGPLVPASPRRAGLTIREGNAKLRKVPGGGKGQGSLGLGEEREKREGRAAHPRDRMALSFVLLYLLSSPSSVHQASMPGLYSLNRPAGIRWYSTTPHPYLYTTFGLALLDTCISRGIPPPPGPRG